jgi:hypothetical protein
MTPYGASSEENAMTTTRMSDVVTGIVQRSGPRTGPPSWSADGIRYWRAAIAAGQGKISQERYQRELSRYNAVGGAESHWRGPKISEPSMTTEELIAACDAEFGVVAGA